MCWFCLFINYHLPPAAGGSESSSPYSLSSSSVAIICTTGISEKKNPKVK